jgi:hypothetical protein
MQNLKGLRPLAWVARAVLPREVTMLSLQAAWKLLGLGASPGRAVAVAAVIACASPAQASLRRDLREAVRSNRGALERCYDRELKRDHPATGTVVIALVVNRSGRVSRVRVAQAAREQEEVGACLVGKLRRLKLPAQRSRVAVLLPVRLRTRSG